MELPDRAVARRERVWGRPLLPHAPSLPCVCSWAPSSLAPSFPPLSALDPCTQAENVDLSPQRVTRSSSAALLTGASSLAPPPAPGPTVTPASAVNSQGAPHPCKGAGHFKQLRGDSIWVSHPQAPCLPFPSGHADFNGWTLEGRSEQPI